MARQYDDKDPTQRQLAFAHKLGLQIPAGVTRGELSDLIDRRLNRKRKGAGCGCLTVIAIALVLYFSFLRQKGSGPPAAPPVPASPPAIVPSSAGILQGQLNAAVAEETRASADAIRRWQESAKAEIAAAASLKKQLDDSRASGVADAGRLQLSHDYIAADQRLKAQQRDAVDGDVAVVAARAAVADVRARIAGQKS